MNDENSGFMSQQRIDSPLGTLVLLANDVGVVSLSRDFEEENSLAAGTKYGKAHIADAKAWLAAYFARADLPAMPALCWALVPNDFARRALHALADVGWGSTCTYADLAIEMGAPGAARAVGGAMARNPWPIFLGCHRILRSDGGLGGFALGVTSKKFLLMHEKQN